MGNVQSFEKLLNECHITLNRASRTDGEDARRVGVLPEVVGVGVAVEVKSKSRACMNLGGHLSICT